METKTRHERWTDIRKAVRAGERITAQEFAELGYEEPCELVEGKIIPMAPTFWRHGSIEMRVGGALDEFASEHDLGEVMVGEVGVYTHRDPDTVRGADVLFISHERLAEATPNDYLDVAPELIVEVLSASNTKQEMRGKIAEYFSIGVERVWIIEPQRRTAQIYRSPDAARTLGADEALEGEGVLEGFHLPLETLFEA